MKRLGCTQERILRYLKHHRGALRTTEIALALGLSTDRVRIALRKMIKSGHVTRNSVGTEVEWLPIRTQDASP